MNNFTHIITSDFSRKAFGGVKNWWEYRLSFFEHFTLQSLKNQTNKNFYFLMNLRRCFPDRLVSELKRILDESKLKYAIVYLDSESSFKEQIEKYFCLSDYIYSTRIDSDDLFHKDVVQEIQSYDFAWQRALVFQKGYCYDCINQKLQHYKVLSPPNSTIMYPKEVFLDQEKRREYMNFPQGHDQIFSKMKSVVLSENKYVIMIHKHNRRSVFSENPKLNRELIPKDKHSEILKNFGIDTNTFQKVKFS